MKEFLSESVYFGVTVSMIGYAIGLFLKKKFKSGLLNPLLISIIFVIGLIKILNIDYSTYEKTAHYLGYLLTPATVALAIPLYQKMELLKKNMAAVMGGILSGVIASLVSIWGMALIFHLNHQEYVTLLPKSITTAIGIGVSDELGGMTTITVAVIIVTGVLGNVIGQTICKLFKIYEPIAVGLAFGTSAHAIGTTKAMEIGEVEGAMSSLSIAGAGVLTVAGAAVFSSFI